MPPYLPTSDKRSTSIKYTSVLSHSTATQRKDLGRRTQIKMCFSIRNSGYLSFRIFGSGQKSETDKSVSANTDN
jgi:hypothetical protein